MNFKTPRGTYDLYANNMRLRQKVVDDIMTIMHSYMYETIETPIFEEKQLFTRTNGEDTDIVNKEMYDFVDKKGRELALRPELTAPVARSYVSEKMYALNPEAKYCYYMPAFRYERPQSGRYRQFYQIGVENYGPKNAVVDCEVISLVYSILTHFDLQDDVVLKINSIGTIAERKNYNEQLVKYYSSNVELLCSDCKERLKNNPLRLLDCKICNQKPEFNNPPLITDYFTNESKEYFEQVLELLTKLDISYEIDNKLVRGLDYYNDTVFEFVDKSSGQAICGGGRYDHLLEQISNQSSTAFGFGLGVERFINILMEKEQDLLSDFDLVSDIIYIPLTEEAIAVCMKSMNKLRTEGIKCVMNNELKSLKNNLKLANKYNCVYAVIVGEDELNNGIVKVKNLIDREETDVELQLFEDEILGSEGHE